MVRDIKLFDVAGVSFSNDDGSSRQRYISRLHEGDRLYFQHFEYEGEDAFHVVNDDFHCIGNVPKEYVKDVHDAYYSGSLHYSLYVSDISARDENDKPIPGYNQGVTVEFCIYDDEPNPARPAPQPDASSTAADKPQKTGIGLIIFGVICFFGTAASPLFLIAAAVLLFFGIRRRVAFKKAQSAQTPAAPPSDYSRPDRNSGK